MSQVRKLLQGNVVPKAENGYKFQLDSQDVYFTDDDLREIDNQIAALPMDYRRFLGNATTAIKKGNQSGNRAENTVTIDQLTIPNNRTERRLKSKKPTYWEAITNADSYVAKEAINEYLNILSKVVNSSKDLSKTTISNSKLELDFNPDAEGKLALSSEAAVNYDARRRINQILDHIKAGDKSTYNVDNWGSLDWINDWENKLDKSKYPTASSYFDDLWNRMSTPGYNWNDNPGDVDILNNFGIGFKRNDEGTSDTAEEVVTYGDIEQPLKDGKIEQNKLNSDGTYIIFNGNGKNGFLNGATYTTFQNPDDRPYLLTEERLSSPQWSKLDKSYLNGIIYKNRIYKPEEVSQNAELQNIMNQVVWANNSANTINDVYDKDNLNSVWNLLNFTDYDNNYVSYNGETDYMPYKYHQLRGALGEGNYAIFNPTSAYDTGGTNNEIFGVYDFNSPGDQNMWGFRSPSYYISGDGSLTGPLTYIPEGYTFLNRNWDPMNEYSKWININGKEYGLVGQFWGADAHDTTPYSIYESRDGSLWHKSGNGSMIKLDDDLAIAIITGVDENGNAFKPNHRQMLYGTLNGKPRNGSSWEKGMYTTSRQFKDGGEINNTKLKPLPQKFQAGSRFMPAPIKAAENEEYESPLHDPSNIWETLTPMDKKEITAAAIDVAGAMANLAGPIGSIAGAVSGIGASTPLFMSASKQRKGYLDASDWGQAALATGLDLVSLIPYLGEVGKITKIAKSVTKAAIPLGKAFSVLGLSEAASVLSKDPKDWDTNDLLKLSAGIQSVINIGHGLHVRRGESALANKISETIGVKETKPTHAYKIGDKEIKLTDAQVNAITEKGNNPEEILKGILRGENVSDEELNNVPDLLNRFGFELSSKGIGKKKHTVATVKEPEQPKKYTKNGYIWDEFIDPLGKRERARRQYIDQNIETAKKFRNDLFDSTDDVVSINRMPREGFTEVITDKAMVPKTDLNKDAAMARAYLQSLARTNSNKVTTSWTKPIDIKQKYYTSTNVYREPNESTSDFIADKTLTQLTAGQPSDLAKKMSSDTRNLFDNAGTVEEQIAKAVSSRIPNFKPKHLGRVQNLGANAMSNKELRRYIIGNATEQGLTEQEAVEFLNGLSDRKRASLLNELQKSSSKKVQGILSHFDDFGRNKQMRMAKMAENIKMLRESSNPMQALSQLSKENDAIDIANNNTKEFREALNELLRNTVYKKLNGPRLDRQINRIEKYRSSLGFDFKDGGIIKAYNGVSLYPQTKHYSLYPDGYEPDFNITHKPSGSLNIDLTNSNQDQYSLYPKGYDSKFETKSLTQIDDEDDIDTGGGPNKNLSSKLKWINPAISLFRYFNTARLQKKYRDTSKKAIEAARFHETPVTLNTIDTNSPILDRALSENMQERSANIKNSTSDVVTNYALQNDRSQQLYNRERDIIGQKSQYQQQMNIKNTDIMNQNIQNQIVTSNNNRARDASIDSALYNPDLEYMQRRDASNQALTLEVQNNVKRDIDLLTAYNRTQKENELMAATDSYIDSLAPGKRAEYNALPYNERIKYSSFSDYLEKTDPNFGVYRSDIERRNKEDQDEMLKWIYQNGLNYGYDPWLTGKTSTVGISKKGGRINGTTRYTLEPDERIWIDNNKAAHAAIAKLSDNTIKLLLRALK